jgi:lysozyme
MKTNDAGVALIKSFEGCLLTAYQDQVGVWTIGFGSTTNVTPGMVITEEEAEERLRDKLTEFEGDVFRYVHVPLTENQHAALVSFTYNLGPGTLHQSTLLKKVNANDMQGAADEFLKWCRAGGKVVPGLQRRRIAERELFLTP